MNNASEKGKFDYPFTSFLGTEPVIARSFSELPYLKYSTGRFFARRWSMSLIGTAITLLFAVITIWSVKAIPEPIFRALATGGLFLPYALIVTSLFALTIGISYKQFKYYYGKRMKTERGIEFCGINKEAIFVRNVRQVNPIEGTFDYLLGVLGPLLYPLTFFPSWWFIGLSVYSLLAVLRCGFTVSRPWFSNRLKNNGYLVPNWYDDISNPELPSNPYKKASKKYRVRTVMIGWVFTHAFIAAFSLAMGLLPQMPLFGATELIYLFFISFASVIILYFGANILVYRFVSSSSAIRKRFML